MPRKKPYRRNSLRMPNHDYSSPGWHFVTLNIQDRKPLFVEIKQKDMWLNDFGRVAAKTSRHLEELYDHIGLDAWVIMPDHMHGIICIFENDGPPSLPHLRSIKRTKSPALPEPIRTEPISKGLSRTAPTDIPVTKDHLYARAVR